MKKFYTLSFILLASLSFGQVTDTFTGSGLLSANGWTAHSGTVGPITISAGSLTYPGLTPTGNKIALVATLATEDVNKSVGTAITGVAYFSAVVNFPNTTGLVADYSMALGATTGASVTAFFGRLFFKPGVAANTFNIGIVNASGTGSLPNYMATDYPIGTPVFIVVKYDRSNNTAYLFVNPALDTTEPAANLTNATGATAAPTSIQSIVIRQGSISSTTSTGNVEFDDVRAGSTWAYVTSSTLALSVKQDKISGLNVYPNPVKDGNLYITSNSSEAKTVAVYDVLGKEVLNAKTSNNAVNVSNLKGGAYIVKITEDGKTDTRKLIIE